MQLQVRREFCGKREMNQPINAFKMRTHSAGKHGVQTGLRVPIVLIEIIDNELKVVFICMMTIFPAWSGYSGKGSIERWVLLIYLTGNESVLESNVL